MRQPSIFALLALLLCTYSCSFKTQGPHRLKRRFDVDRVEASFPVAFSQAIAGNHHYVAYFDQDKNFSIGYRKLNQKAFQKTILDSKIAWDSHNFTEIIVDEQGYIHVSGNMHNVPLNYWRSERPYDASAFEAIHYMTGTEENRVTYPHFLQTNQGDLLFHYRHGGSGNGYEVYNQWIPETKTWKRFLDQPLIDGEGEKNAYMSGPFYEKDGHYHLYWVWRQSPDCSTNHDFSYARSKDLIHWESPTGEPVVSPMVFGETKLKVDPSAIQGSGMLNGVQSHVVDSKDRMVLCNMKYDANGHSQLYVYRLGESGEWNQYQITSWDYRFAFSGWGSIIFAVKLKGMRQLDNGRIGVAYEHLEYGNGEIILDEESLQVLEVKEYEFSYPAALNEVTTPGSYTKPIEVNIDQSGKYILRWETLPPNNDQKPEGKMPPPYMMELIELKK